MRVMHLAVAAVVAHAPAIARAEGGLAAATSFAPAAPDGGAAAGAGLGPAGMDPGDLSEVEAPGWRGRSRWGLSLGAGFPDFATASVMYRPAGRIRVWAGPSWNSRAWGLQGGAALVPFSSWIAPVLAVEAGRFFRSDLSSFTGDSSGIPAGASSLLEKVDFAFAAIDVGLDLGSPRGFSLGLRVGLSYVSVASSGTATFESDSGSGAQVRISDPSLRGTLPSAKLALQYWF